MLLQALDRARALFPTLESASPEQVSRAVRQPRASLDDLAALLSPAAQGDLEFLAQESHRRTLARFGRTVQMFAPLYLSNECVNICTYCGFSRDNKISRRTLTPDEVEREWDHLAAQKFQHLLLVAGEDPRYVPMPYLLQVVERLRPKTAALSLEIAPLEEPEYRRLVSAGVDGIVVYQETYEPAIYAEVHEKGPKRHYEWRLEALERAAAAGVRRLGMGVLLGLSDWRRDALMLFAHARWLERIAWRSELAISLPRLRPAAGEYEPRHPVSDRDLAQMVCAARFAVPTGGIVLSTREAAGFREKLLPLGITQMSAGSHTEPGGYTLEESRGEAQFEIVDHRSPAEVAARVAELGYEPVWKDWSEAFAR